MATSSSGRMTKAEIEARLAVLEAENAQLREKAEAAEAASASTAAVPPTVTPRPRRSTGRAVGSVIMILIGALLAPAAIVTSWVSAEVSDTDRFVSTLAPLIDEPAVQAYLTAEISNAVVTAVDPDAVVTQAFGYLVPEDAPAVVGTVIDRLVPLVTSQVEAGVHSAVATVVASDAFSDVWEASLRAAHSSFVSIMDGADDDSILAIDDSGTLVVQLGPIVELIRPKLVDAGFGIASLIPEVTATVDLLEIPWIVQARLAYQLLTTAGWLLPVLSILLLVGGVLLAPRRPRALVLLGISVLITAGVLVVGLPAGRGVVQSILSDNVPATVTAIVFDGLTSVIAATALAVVIVAVIALLAGLIAGRSSSAVRLRSSVSELTGRANGWLVGAGLPEAVPSTLRRLSWVVWALLALAGVLVLLLVRPLTPGAVLLTALILAIVALVVLLLRGPAVLSSETATEEAAEATA